MANGKVYTKLSEGIYKLKSFTEMGKDYNINLWEQTCDCIAFQMGKTKPCKHLEFMNKEVKVTQKDRGSVKEEGQEDRPFLAVTKKGYPLDEVVSALQKCIRRGEEDNSLYWALEMALSGYSAYCWRRLAVIAGEDIGIANPQIFSIVADGKKCNDIAMKDDPKKVETNILATVVILMARSPKSREACWADWFIQRFEQKLPVPDCAVDMHTKRGREMGRVGKAGEKFFAQEGGKLKNDTDPNSKWTLKAKEEFGK